MDSAGRIGGTSSAPAACGEDPGHRSPPPGPSDGAGAARTGGAGEYAAVAALSVILAVTAVWWALALWPLPESAPEWLLRTRAVCFRPTPTGLPDRAGWLALILQPATMLGILLVVWGDSVGRALRAMARAAAGRLALGVTAAAVLAGIGSAAGRVAGAVAQGDKIYGGEALPVPSTHPRLDRPAPPLDGLVDQYGDAVGLDRFRGRPVLVTFAYAHCATVCPLLVHDVLSAQRMLRDDAAGTAGPHEARAPHAPDGPAARAAAPPGAAELREHPRPRAGPPAAPAVLIVTLDPWRDTPARLPAIATSWKLGEDAYVASGEPPPVAALLERWAVAWSRDERTGEITHASLAYVVDAQGTITYVASGSAGLIVELASRL